MGTRVCEDCVASPVMKCGRCTLTRCQRHALAANRRCDRCERDWQAEAPTRRAAKLIFVPPIAVLVGGLLFGLLLPISFSALGAAIMCALVCGLAVGAGAATCRLVDHSSRVMFLRERVGGLPPMRLLSAPKR
jgi:hypothetical protein